MLERVLEKGTLLYCRWDCELVQPLWQTIWRFLKTLKIELPYDSAIPHMCISSVQSLSHVRLFVTPWTEAYQASLSITSSRTLHKLMSMESLIPSNHLILCGPLLLLPSIFPRLRVFSKESVLCIRYS